MFMRNFLQAGAETTYRLIGKVSCSVTHPDQLDAVRRDPRTLIPQAVEEAIRWETPVLVIQRTATRDVVVDGVTIPAWCLERRGVPRRGQSRPGTATSTPTSSTCSGPRWAHVGFGTGPHHCVGMHLARMEAAVALYSVLDRLTNLRLDPAAPDVHVRGVILRTPEFPGRL